MSEPWSRLLPLLVHVQTHLDGDLSLAALARVAGLSPSYLQRLFLAHVGESPKRYVTRLRLEQAAFRMLVGESALLDLALDSGYRSHETFTRAFSRRFGAPPSAYRADRRLVRPRRPVAPPSRREERGASPPDVSLSATRVTRLRAADLAFIRHLGPYEAVPDRLFRDLDAWARARRLPGPRLWMGIGHDAPGTTAARHLRFDAALGVPRPFSGAGRIAYQRFEGGDFAVTTHVGPYDSLSVAYRVVVERVLALPRWQLVGLPAVEIYRTTQVNVRRHLNHTDICLPVRRR